MAISVTKPTIGGSEDTWGTTINNALDVIVDAANGTTGLIEPNLTQGSWQIGSTAITITAAELNVIDGDTAATSTTVADADRVVFNDNGTMKQVSMSDINTYIQSQAGSANNASITISAGNAVTGGGTFTTNQGSNQSITINHEDTSSQSSVNNSGSTYIQDITLDTYGHVTGITSSDASSSIGGWKTTGSVSGQMSASVSFNISSGYANRPYINGTSSCYTVQFGGLQVGTTNSQGQFSVSAGGTNQNNIIQTIIYGVF